MQEKLNKKDGIKIEKKFGKLEAEKAVLEMEQAGYLDDERTACNYIRAKLKSGYGPYYILLLTVFLLIL